LQTARLLQFPLAMDANDNLILDGARVARSPYNAKYRTLFLRGPHIESITMTGVADPPQGSKGGPTIDLSEYMILPGLINAHDHLDFSLFPRLGRGPYPGWREWAADIHRSERSSIEECLRVSRDARISWGGIRNLLSGVTTVSHHNPYLSHVFGDQFPVHVPREYGWAHSLSEIRRLVERLHQTPSDWPFILHLAEGTDEVSQREFDVLESLVPLKQRIVLVHCVGLTPPQHERVSRSGAGVVWCPSSNLYTLGSTLTADQISVLPNVALGTDSPLTACGDLLDEIRLAHETLGVPAPLMYELVTTRAARLLRLKSGEGNLQAGAKADLIVTRDRQLMPAETLLQLSWRDLELVMEKGRIVLLSPALANRIPSALKQGMEWISIDGVKRLLRAPVRNLFSETFASMGRTPVISGRKLSPVRPAHASACEIQPLSELHRPPRSESSIPS
jgi:cytosine/adenosine deaminase-related metal-dependent hydrolase